MFDNPMGTSFHADVLSAMPSDDTSRDRLVEELKNRAKASIKASNHYDATKLYMKAIDTLSEKDSRDEPSCKKDLAILYANKSMCELNMRQYASALSDANNAISYDSTYVKGYYRKAMVLIEEKDYVGAKEALDQGLKVQPNEKEFLSQLAKIQTLIASGLIAKPSSAPSSASSSAASSAKSSVGSSKPKSSDAASLKKSEASKTESSASATPMDIEDDEKISLARGYRKTADGRTTTFFNHELDENTKKLIGDIAPKKIEVADPSVAVTVNDSSTTSVWNSAGTYEERVYTPWATERLKAILTTRSPSTWRVKEVTKIEGDAQISMLRGKRKHIYDFTIELSVLVSDSSSGGADVLEGTASIADITADQEYGVTVVLKPIAGAAKVVSNDEVAKTKKVVTSDIEQLLQSFDKEFKQK